jgi:hypothetical protein
VEVLHTPLYDPSANAEVAPVVTSDKASADVSAAPIANFLIFIFISIDE